MDLMSGSIWSGFQPHLFDELIMERPLQKTLTIVLDLPPDEIHPNARKHWSKRVDPVATSRLYAKLHAINSMNRLGWMQAPRWTEAETRTTFYFSTKRRRDRDNCGAWLKPYWDGIADAGVIANDSGFIHHPPTLLIDKDRPRVEIVITERTAE